MFFCNEIYIRPSLNLPQNHSFDHSPWEPPLLSSGLETMDGFDWVLHQFLSRWTEQLLHAFPQTRLSLSDPCSGVMFKDASSKKREEFKQTWGLNNNIFFSTTITVDGNYHGQERNQFESGISWWLHNYSSHIHNIHNIHTITLHYSTVHYNTLHYITLHNIT